LADFSGYLTMDELYDGPFCILSIVDNRSYKRLFYQVLEHDPNHDDMLTFMQRFPAILILAQNRRLGIMTGKSGRRSLEHVDASAVDGLAQRGHHG
jgi:hypothetical protein